MKLSVGEVVVLMCTSNPQSMSAKLQLEVCKHEIMFLFTTTRSKRNVNSLYLALGFLQNRCLNTSNIMGKKSEMKLDIDLRSFATPCSVYEVSLVTF